MEAQLTPWFVAKGRVISIPGHLARWKRRLPKDQRPRFCPLRRHEDRLSQDMCNVVLI